MILFVFLVCLWNFPTMLGLIEWLESFLRRSVLCSLLWDWHAQHCSAMDCIAYWSPLPAILLCVHPCWSQVVWAMPPSAFPSIFQMCIMAAPVPGDSLWRCSLSQTGSKCAVCHPQPKKNIGRHLSVFCAQGFCGLSLVCLQISDVP
jgi:hypothetical protein